MTENRSNAGLQRETTGLVRLFPSSKAISLNRYATSSDARGYIPVYEYAINGQAIMIDCENGMVHFTGIWKALNYSKADLAKALEAWPETAGQAKRIKGGYLKIQGTWLPFEMARSLAQDTCYDIANELVPLFGLDFPMSCTRASGTSAGQSRRRREGASAGASSAPPSTSSFQSSSQTPGAEAVPPLPFSPRQFDAHQQWVESVPQSPYWSAGSSPSLTFDLSLNSPQTSPETGSASQQDSRWPSHEPPAAERRGATRQEPVLPRLQRPSAPPVNPALAAILHNPQQRGRERGQ